MIRDRVRTYYVEGDMNCAEAVLHAANDEYGLGISDESFKLIGGFGGGLGCGSICGALTGGIAAIGQQTIETKAHDAKMLKERCAALVKDFNDRLGTDNCEELKARYRTEDSRCLEIVLSAADALDEILGQSDT